MLAPASHRNVAEGAYWKAYSGRSVPKRFDGGQVRAYLDMVNEAMLQDEPKQVSEDDLQAWLAEEHREQTAIARDAGYRNLVLLLMGTSPESVEAAARAFRVHSADPTNHTAIRLAGGVAALTTLLANGAQPTVIRITVRALWNLAAHADNKTEIRRQGGIPPLVELLVLGGDAAHLEAITGTLNSLAVDDANKLAIVNAGAIAPLLELLGEGPTNVCKQLAGATLRELSVNPSICHELLRRPDSSPALRRSIAGDTLVDGYVVALGRQASSFFAPVAEDEDMLRSVAVPTRLAMEDVDCDDDDWRPPPRRQYATMVRSIHEA